MIKSLIESILMPIKKPAVLIPGILFILTDFIFRYLTEESAIEILFNFFEFSSYPVFTLDKMPFYFISSYSGEVIFLALILGISTVIGLMFSVSIANYIFEKKSIINSVVFAVKNLMKIIGLVLFFGLILLFSAAVLWLVMLFALASGLIGVILLLLVILLMGFVLIHFAFVPALIGKGMKIKQALKESWNFSAKNLMQLILLLIGITIINFVLGQAYLQILNTSFGETDLMILVEMIFSLIILSYTNIVFPLFYLNTNK